MFFFVPKAIFIMQSHDFFRFMPKKLTGTVAQFLRRIFIIFNGTFFTLKEKNPGILTYVVLQTELD